MPSKIKRQGGLGGLRDLDGVKGADPSRWDDSDKALVTRDGAIRSWPGYQRNRKLYDAAVHGASSNRIDIIAAHEDDIRKEYGKLLACVDRNANTEGRVLAIGHAQGLLGSQIIGRPAQITGSGLDDLLTRATPYTGTAERVYVVEIDGTGTPDTFRWSRDGGSTWAASAVAITGGWQTLELGIQVKFEATTGHTSGNNWAFATGGRPALLGSLDRVHPHQYPRIVASGGKALISDPFNPAWIDNGTELQRATLPPPRIKPQVSQYNTGAAGDPYDLGETNAGSLEWASHSESSTTPTRQTASGSQPDPEDTAMVRLRIPEADRRGGINLAYNNKSATIASTVKSIRIRIWVDGSRGWVRPGVFSVILASSSALGGTEKELKINTPMRVKAWHTIDLPWRESSSFSMASIGLKLRKSLGPRWFDSGGNLDVYIDLLTMDATSSGGAGQTQSSGLFEDIGQYALRFNWKRRADGKRSPWSPVSDLFEGNSTRVRADASGYYPGIVDGLINSPPDEADAIEWWITNTTWGTDPRTGGLGFMFYRLTDLQGEAITDHTAGSNGELFIEFSDEFEELSLINAPDNEAGPFWNGTVITGELAAEDNERVAIGGRPSYKVGEWNVENGSHVVTPVSAGTADTPIPSPAWEEFLCVAEGELDAYRIIKYIEPNSTYAKGALFIGKDFDPRTQEFATPYQGTTGTAKLIILGDASHIHVTNKTSQDGADITQMSVLNKFRAMPHGDFYRAFFELRGYLWVFGSATARTMRQNEVALDDEPAQTGAAYGTPEPAAEIGIMGARTWAVHQGRAYIMTPQGELYTTDGTGMSKHPASDALRSFLAGKGHITDTRTLIHSWMRVVPIGGALFLYIGLISGTAAKAEGIEFRQSGVLTPGSSLGVEEEYEIDGASGVRWPLTSSAALSSTGIDNDDGYILWTGGDEPSAATTVLKADFSFATGEHTYPGKGLGHSFNQEVPAGISLAGTYLINFDRTSQYGGVYSKRFREVIEHDTVAETVTLAEAWGTDPTSMLGLFAAPDLFVFARVDPSFQPQAYDNFPSGTREGWKIRVDPSEAYVHPDGTDGIGKISNAPDFYIGWRCILAEGTDDGYQGLVQGWDPTTGELIVVESTRLQMPNDFDDWDSGSYEKPAYLILVAPSGQQATTSSGTLSEPEDEPYVYVSSRDSAPPAIEIDTAALTNDFQVGVMVDLASGAVFPGSECPFTVSGIEPAGSATAKGQVPGPLWLGDKHGYLSMMDDKILGWGAPGPRLVYQVDPDSPGDSNTVNIKPLIVGETERKLPVGDDDASILEELIVAKLSAGRVLEFKLATSNTATSIDISGQWNVTPVSGDLVMIAPLAAFVRFAQSRGDFYRTTLGFTAQLDLDEGPSALADPIPFEPLLIIDQWASEADEDEIKDHAAHDVRNVFPIRKLKVGRKILDVTPVTGRAVQWAIHMLNTQRARPKLSRPGVRELVSSAEGQT